MPVDTLVYERTATPAERAVLPEIGAILATTRHCEPQVGVDGRCW